MIKVIDYKDKKYAIMGIKYKDYKLPIILDYDNYKKIEHLDKKWRCNKNGYVFCNHMYNGTKKEIYLHDVIMNLIYKDETKDKPILHINRINLDNRLENLIYNDEISNEDKIMKKKKRSNNIPDGIDPNSIPTYVWYKKATKTHGDKFVIEIGDTKWCSTCSKNVNTIDKLEDAKKYLRHLKISQPHLFKQYSMNGDYTEHGKNLLTSYYDIIHQGGYDNITKNIPDDKTDAYIT
jgi:hypothetical protein